MLLNLNSSAAGAAAAAAQGATVHSMSDPRFSDLSDGWMHVIIRTFNTLSLRTWCVLLFFMSLDTSYGY